jgi:hypothetical protein
MKEVTQKNFGWVIAYVVPGLVTLWGVSFFSATVKVWLTSANGASPSVAGFLYVTLASLAAGLTVGAVRSIVIDPLHHWTGIPKPELDFSDFQAKFWAFNQIVEGHYRYYQFYAHMAIAVLFVFAAMIASGMSPEGDRERVWISVGVGLLELVLVASSREAVRTYYARASDLLGTHHGEEIEAGKRARW